MIHKLSCLQCEILRRKIHLRHVRCFSSKITVSNSKIVGIRREDINVWERRAAIAPQHVKELKDKGGSKIYCDGYLKKSFLKTSKKLKLK